MIINYLGCVPLFEALARREGEMAKIEIEVPDDLIGAIGATPEERSAFALRALALECFQAEMWSKDACGRLMGTSRLEFDGLLMLRGIPDN